MKLVLNGVEYDDVQKQLKKIPVLYYIELEDQAGISTDAMDAGALSYRRTLAAMAFLLRRNAGEAVTFKQAAIELIVEDALVEDPSGIDAEPEDGDGDPPVSVPSSPSGG